MHQPSHSYGPAGTNGHQFPEEDTTTDGADRADILECGAALSRRSLWRRRIGCFFLPTKHTNNANENSEGSSAALRNSEKATPGCSPCEAFEIFALFRVIRRPYKRDLASFGVSAVGRTRPVACLADDSFRC
jgi:hypothetical protein